MDESVQQTFGIKSWTDWSPGQSGQGKETLPSILRRRISPLGQEAMAAAMALSDVGDARIILTSRHGEFTRTLSILESLAIENTVSPADFSLSVHHALIGLLSIVKKNRSGHTALAAGVESFFFGLVEAAACLADNPQQDVLLIHCDEPLIDPYTLFNPPDSQPFAAALLLSATEGEKFTMQFAPCANDNASGALAAGFFAFIGGPTANWIAPGQHMQWQWTRHAAV